MTNPVTLKISMPINLAPVRHHVWILAAPHIRVVVRATDDFHLEAVPGSYCHPALKAFFEHWLQRISWKIPELCEPNKN